MPSRAFNILIATFTLTSAACGANFQEQETLSPTAFAATSTIAPSRTPHPSETALPPPASLQPTVAPIDGITSTQVNVRAEPSTVSSILGIIPADMRVEIVGKDPGENWWQILYPQGTSGKGWVTAQYVRPVREPKVPVIGAAGTDPNTGTLAVIQQRLNIRSGPGIGFDSIGTLNAEDAVTLTGKDVHGTWLQIEFIAGPDGKGWINAAFVRATGVDELPIVTEAGVVIGTGTPTNPPPPPTATLIPAWMDNDSPDNPISHVAFDPSGTGTLIYNGDVSAPEGDIQDWIGFTPYGTLILVSLACTRDNSLKIDILENNRPTDLTIQCGQHREGISVKAGAKYLIQIKVNRPDKGLIYTNYILTIKMSP